MQAADHVREHGSLLAGPEKRALLWLAQRMPGWVTSDHLTLLALAAMLGAGLAFWAARWYPLCLPLVVLALALNWFGDSLDGTLARVRRRQRPRYGFYVDHVLDIVGTLFLVGGLALSGHMQPLIALGFLVAYLMVAAEIFLATHARGVFRLSFWRIGPTELRILLALGSLELLRQPRVELRGFGSVRLFDLGGLVAIAALGLALVVATVRNTRALYRAEPLPR
ncbi:MAG TPA: CDP-alcohol phosphatidyltransferase family protein [Acidobacteriota bacterium]